MAASSSEWPVHQLWPPSGGKQRTELDVVLFHGLQLTANDTSDAWSRTWTQRGHDDVCWPREWLPFDLGEAVRIFSVSYNAHVVTSPYGHVSEIANMLFQTLMSPRYEWHHPIVLIGHSFGGLVLKSLVVKLKTMGTGTDSWSKAAVQCGKEFLNNVRGVAFYAVPHAGSTKFAEYVTKLLRCNNRHLAGILHNIEPKQRDMEDLSADFDDIVNENKINICAFCEGRPMEQVGILVDFSSAQQSAGVNSYKVEDADHMEVCKPPSKAHPSYGLLLQFIITCGKVAKECNQPLQEVHDLPQSMFGLESYVERVETLVTSQGSDTDPQYVGVWGMGGVGKTLLLQRVYGSPNVHGHFQGAKFIWLTVGQTPDIMALYRTLSAELGLEPEKTAIPEVYKHKLFNRFKQRRVFLVLDDVWKVEAFNSLDLARGKGSVTMLSTRDQSILDRISRENFSQQEMVPLLKEDSWSLFCEHAFKPPSNVPCELVAVARLVAEECQGLPLALKVVGGAMFGKTSPELEWKPLLKRLKKSHMQERSVKEGLYERLKLGYDLLSEDDWRLKDCFLYFAAFPENSRISFDNILWHWIGEGLVPGHSEDDPRADAFSLLKKLWERSFIESDKVFVLDEEDLPTFKVNNVMRQLAFYILENDSGTTLAKQLYLYRAGQNLEEFPQEWKAKTAVHQLWPPPGDMRKTEMNILFFHGYSRDPDEWKSAWTQHKHPDVCWPEKWLPADLDFNARVLFVSYYGQSCATDVVNVLFKTLVIRDEWDLCKNHQPLVLVGRGFGTLVLDNLFVKAMEEVVTSPTEAGAFVRNVRGVTLYGDNVKRYKIEKFFGGRLEHIEHVRVATFSPNLRHAVFITQGSMLNNPAIYRKNLTRDVVGMDPCQWIKEDIWEDWDPEVQWKPQSKQSRGYNLLLESCQMVYQFEAIRATLEHLQQKLDNITTACDISNYSDSMFENEFTYLRHNGIEGAKILIVQCMLATMGVDVEQHMVVKKSDDGEQLENEGKLAILKFTVARFCDNHEWHMVPEMRESDMRHTIESSLNDVVDGIPPLSDDVMNNKMQRERERESMDHFDREAFRGDGNDTVPIHFPSIREQTTMSVKQLQQLACNMRPGENLPQEDVQEQLMAHMAQVLHGGKLIVTANMLEGKIQFLFGNAKSMAQIVGVGLDFATVSLTRQNVIVVEGITKLEWTTLWGEVFLGQSLFENPIFMEEVVISPPDHEEPQGSHVNALSTIAMFFMIQKFQQNLDVGKAYNQVVRRVATTMTEEKQSDIWQVHAESLSDPSAGILDFNLWDCLSMLQITRGLVSATRDTSGDGGRHLGGTGTPSEGDKDQGGDGGLGSATRDTSGEGGSHLGGTDTPSEGDKNQGGDGGEDNDNHKGQGAKGKEIQQNNRWEFLVTVHPGFEHMGWIGNDLTEQLNNSHITPTLEFLFQKTEEQRSNTIGSKIEVCCDMDTTSLDPVNDGFKHFGWCQNHLHVALQCLGKKAATLCGERGLVGTRDLKNTYMEQTQATCSQATFGVTGGYHGFASVSASFTKPFSSTLRSNQMLREMPCEVISGTGFRPECHNHGGETPCLKYDFKFHPEFPTTKFPDESDQDMYNGMRCTVYPSFKGGWGLLNQDEACEYEFRVERHVFKLVCVAQSLNSKKSGLGKQKLSPTCKRMLQTYKVRLFINHKMSNIGTLPKFGTDTLSEAYPKNALIKLSVDPSVCGSDYASSSTQ